MFPGLEAGDFVGHNVAIVTTLSFKVSDEEARQIRRQAKLAGISVSEFLRHRAIGTTSRGAVDRVRCEFTGAEIFAPLTGAKPLTTEMVREMLADFP
jgi:hypothetical protein